VPGVGLEPTRLAAGDFESPTSTNFITRAKRERGGLWHKILAKIKITKS